MNTPEEIEAHAWLVFCPPNRDECDYRIYWDKEHAEIMDEDYRDCDDDADHRTQGVHDLILRSDHDKAIADAVAAERAKFAAFCDEKERYRKALEEISERGKEDGDSIEEASGGGNYDDTYWEGCAHGAFVAGETARAAMAAQEARE